MQDTLMTKLLDGQDKMIEKLATVSEIVRRHDEVTFPEMKLAIKDISDTVTRIDSKHNKDIILLEKKGEEDRERARVNNENINKRLNLLEVDYNNKVENKKEVKTKIKEIIWGGVEKVIYIIIGGGATLWLALKAKYFN